MKRSAIVTLLIGLTIAITLAATHDVGRILQITASAGWGIATVIALHLPQIVLSAASWAVLVEAHVGFFVYARLRWLRESINALLPVAQIGGDFVRARQLIQRGIRSTASIASVTIDLALELSAQIIFAFIGIALLVAVPHGTRPIGWLIVMTAGTAVLAIALLFAQRFGLFRLLENLLPRLAGRVGWKNIDVDGLHDAAVRLFQDRKRILLCAIGHLASYFAGAIELWATMWTIGVHAGWREAIIIESMGQVVRTMGFAIPGALGVQEGGFILLCAIFGVGAQDAIAMALVRRIRELALGIPGIVVWRLNRGASEKAIAVESNARVETP